MGVKRRAGVDTRGEPAAGVTTVLVRNRKFVYSLLVRQEFSRVNEFPVFVMLLFFRK